MFDFLVTAINNAIGEDKVWRPCLAPRAHSAAAGARDEFKAL
jgi:hypothetical protein